MIEQPRLHCGACQKDMPSIEALQDHLGTCEGSKALLMPVTFVMMGGSDCSHKIGHLATAASKYASTIRDYAFAVATEMDSYTRSTIHMRLCSRLGLEYSDFRPFESEDITEIPTVDEAEAIIWRAIGAILRREMYG